MTLSNHYSQAVQRETVALPKRTLCRPHENKERNGRSFSFSRCERGSFPSRGPYTTAL